MDEDIQFGEVEEIQPDERLRPDQDDHYHVVACQQPVAGELPVYIDIDAMRDIEQHALQDVSVELGGVLLGGQYKDQEGQPFVVVHDCLRAEHYEATKGSFKFTHETWATITRRREGFSDEYEMVGWYHTHPDWGVFLSGMDMFICDNFFNRKLDLALVVDPCRDDRGWFQWTGDPRERVRRTGGFFIFGSRFRESEIEQFSHLLSEETSMSAESRYRAVAGQIGSSSPIVNLHGQRNPLLEYAIIALISIQFIFGSLLGWRILSGDSAQVAATLEELDEQREASESRLGQLERQKEDQIRAAVQTEMLQEFAALTGGDPQTVQRLEDSRLENAQLNESLFAQQLVTNTQREQIAGLEKRLDVVEAKRAEYREELASAKSRLEEFEEQAEEEEGEDGDDGHPPFYKDWKAYVFAGMLLVLGIVGGFALGTNMQAREFDDLHGNDSSRLASAAESLSGHSESQPLRAELEFREQDRPSSDPSRNDPPSQG